MHVHQPPPGPTLEAVDSHALVDDEVNKFVQDHGDAQLLSNGNVLCGPTGLQLRPHLGILTTYWGGKAYAKAKQDGAQAEPAIKPSPNPVHTDLDVATFITQHQDARLLPNGDVLCTLTGATLRAHGTTLLQMYWNGKHYRRAKQAAARNGTGLEPQRHTGNTPSSKWHEQRSSTTVLPVAQTPHTHLQDDMMVDQLQGLQGSSNAAEVSKSE